MARHVARFEFADRGSTSVFKFHFDGEADRYVWFESASGRGSLFRTPAPGPFRAADPLEPAEYQDLDALLRARGTDRAQWVEDLMAQFGERLDWTYP